MNQNPELLPANMMPVEAAPPPPHDAQPSTISTQDFHPAAAEVPPGQDTPSVDPTATPLHNTPPDNPAPPHYRFGNSGNKNSLNVANINHQYPFSTERQDQNNGDGSSSTSFEIELTGSLNVGNIMIDPSVFPQSPAQGSLRAVETSCDNIGYFNGGATAWYLLGNSSNKESLNIGNINLPFAPRPAPLEGYPNGGGWRPCEIGNNSNKGSLNVGNIINPPPPLYGNHGHGPYITNIGNSNNEGSLNVGNIRLPAGRTPNLYPNCRMGNNNNK